MANRRERRAQRSKARRERKKLPTEFTRKYRDPDSLVVIGPLLRAEWSVPDSLARAMQSKGRPLPSPVTGIMLIDTGASRTCISAEAAQRLQLRPVDKARTYGASGLHESEVYQAHLRIRILNDAGIASEIDAELRASSIPSLEESLQPLKVHDGGRPEGPLIGLIGRDFLRHTKFTYDGVSGSIKIQIDFASLTQGRRVRVEPEK